jgi:hypothetical protein
LAALSVVGFVVTLDRFPGPFPDPELYASIARSRQLYGIGVPSALWFSPRVVDHIPFYGPVYFDLVALSFNVFGVSLKSFRLVSLFGALMVASAAGILAATLSGSPRRWPWAVALILLTPEIGASATSGEMETLAVGFELLALAIYVTGIRRNTAVWYGAPAGLVLLLATLTTPRTYPFVLAFLASAVIVPTLSHTNRRAALLQFGMCGGVLIAGLVIWASRSHGSPVQWVRYLAHVLSREDSDVAILRTSARSLAFNWSSLLTPIAAFGGGLAAGLPLVRRSPGSVDDNPGVAFAVLTTCMTAVVVLCGMNLTFTLGMYFALPLFAVVLALPREAFPLRTRAVAVGLIALLAGDAAIAGLKYLRIAATWRAVDPGPINDFVRRYVPEGSAVAGLDAAYFFPVERVGASYRFTSMQSVADWSRWVPEFDPAAANVARQMAAPEPAPRFMIWPARKQLPAEYRCALAELVGSYDPPPDNLFRLGRLGKVVWAGYPATALYRLPPGCPKGYDPTGPREVR